MASFNFSILLETPPKILGDSAQVTEAPASEVATSDAIVDETATSEVVATEETPASEAAVSEVPAQ